MKDFATVIEIRDVVKGMLRSDDEVIEIIESRLSPSYTLPSSVVSLVENHEFKEALSIIKELVEIFDDITSLPCDIDSLTLQPARNFLEKHK